MAWAAALAVVAAIVVAGTGLVSLTGLRLRFEERVAAGAVVGLMATAVAALSTFLVLGMGPATLVAGFGLPLAAGAVGLVRAWAELRTDAADAWRRLRLPLRHRASLRPLTLFTVVSAGVTTRILSIAYPTTPAGTGAGHLAIYGDWAAHLAYAGSFAYGDNRALELPLAAGAPLRYHFLANFLGGWFTTTGLGLQQALLLTTWMVAVAIPVLMVVAVRRIIGSTWAAIVTTVLFILAGGWGFWYFVQDVRENGWSILGTLPRTYSRIDSQHLWVDNTISASLYAQRSTQLGVAVGATALLLVLAARPRWVRRGFAVAGVLVGLTGIAHVHLLVTGVGLGAIAAIADVVSRTGPERRRNLVCWAWYLSPAIVVGAPLAWSINPPQSSLRWELGWMAGASDQPWWWFWLRNVGLLLPVFAWVSVAGGATPRVRRLTAPLWLWFVVPNLVAFHPWDWNNTKFFLFWQFAACLATADLARMIWVRIRRSTTTWWPRLVIGAAFGLAGLSLVASGGLDTVRAMERSTAYPWVDADDMAAAEWLRDHAGPDDRLVYGATNTSAIAALGGVPAWSAYPGWTNDLGMPDWFQRVQESEVMLSGVDGAEELIEQRGIDWVAIGPRERAEMDASDEYWERNGELMFEAGEYRIYAVTTP